MSTQNPTYLELPLSAVNQQFSIFLGGRLWFLRLRWNEDAQAWVIDFSDKDNRRVLTGIPLVTGIDILGQHKHLGIGGGLIIQTDFDPLLAPSYDSLGTSARAFFFQEVQ